MVAVTVMVVDPVKIGRKKLPKMMKQKTVQSFVQICGPIGWLHSTLHRCTAAVLLMMHNLACEKSINFKTYHAFSFNFSIAKLKILASEIGKILNFLLFKPSNSILVFLFCRQNCITLFNRLSEVLITVKKIKTFCHWSN